VNFALSVAIVQSLCVHSELATKLSYAETNAIKAAKSFSRSHDAVIRVYDDAGNVIETHEHKGDFKE
jgi:hypothetical protein